jgi:energy-coupling factor transporter ATP-binding protein EcfA2
MDSFKFEAMAAAFDQLTVKHPKQNAALERAVFLLTRCANVDFVILAGPTGAGKSHLLKRLFQEVNKFYAPQVAKDPSMVPILGTLAVADGAKKFGWKRLWNDGNAGLNDPFLEARSWRTSSDPKARYANESITVAVAREAFEHELRLRKTRAWAIDEAQHLLLGGSAGAVGDQFDVLKSVSQVTPVKLVLCGTYQLPKLLSYSGQVMRRSATVTLAPYDLASASDRREFAGVCKALLAHLPGDSELDPMAYVEDLFFGTLGCVGVLKDWMARAWAHSHFKSKPLTMDDFKATRLPAETLISMHDEIVAGEQMNSLSSEMQYREQVKAHSEKKSVRRPLSKSGTAAAGVAVPRPSGAGIHGRRRVGERLPGRDPVRSLAERTKLQKGGV